MLYAISGLTLYPGFGIDGNDVERGQDPGKGCRKCMEIEGVAAVCRQMFAQVFTWVSKASACMKLTLWIITHIMNRLLKNQLEPT